jgi:cytosine/adenosine deaminase-related metal-dependent hydrolase
VYTVSEDSLRWAGELAADRGLILHIHLAETEAEGSHPPKTPVAGLANAWVQRSCAAHGQPHHAERDAGITRSADGRPRSQEEA